MASFHRQSPQCVGFFTSEIALRNLQTPRSIALTLNVDARAHMPADGDQCVVAAMRPVEPHRLRERGRKRRPAVFTVSQNNVVDMHAKIGGQHASQGLPAVPALVVHLPHVNLVIAQPLC